MDPTPSTPLISTQQGRRCSRPLCNRVADVVLLFDYAGMDVQLDWSPESTVEIFRRVNAGPLAPIASDAEIRAALQPGPAASSSRRFQAAPHCLSW